MHWLASMYPMRVSKKMRLTVYCLGCLIFLSSQILFGLFFWSSCSSHRFHINVAFFGTRRQYGFSLSDLFQGERKWKPLSLIHASSGESLREPEYGSFSIVVCLPRSQEDFRGHLGAAVFFNFPQILKAIVMTPS